MFKAGDKVKCVNIDNTLLLKLNMTYTIAYIEKGEYNNQEYVTLREIYKSPGYYRFGSKRFILDVKEMRKDKIKQICLNSK